jgi:hypothetical protein
MKTIILTVIFVFSVVTAFADNNTDDTKQIIKGLDNSAIQREAKAVYQKDTKGNYGDKETIVDKLLKPLTGAMEFITPGRSLTLNSHAPIISLKR